MRASCQPAGRSPSGYAHEGKGRREPLVLSEGAQRVSQRGHAGSTLRKPWNFRLHVVAIGNQSAEVGARLRGHLRGGGVWVVDDVRAVAKGEHSRCADNTCPTVDGEAPPRVSSVLGLGGDGFGGLFDEIESADARRPQGESVFDRRAVAEPARQGAGHDHMGAKARGKARVR